MALSDQVILMVCALGFSYLVLYKLNRIIGSLFFLFCGIAMYLIVPDNPWGLIVGFGGLIALGFNLFIKD